MHTYQLVCMHGTRETSYLVEVCLHQLKHHVNVLELPGTWGQHDVLDLHNVCSMQASMTSCSNWLAKPGQLCGRAANLKCWDHVLHERHA